MESQQPELYSNAWLILQAAIQRLTEEVDEEKGPELLNMLQQTVDEKFPNQKIQVSSTLDEMLQEGMPVAEKEGPQEALKQYKNLFVSEERKLGRQFATLFKRLSHDKQRKRPITRPAAWLPKAAKISERARKQLMERPDVQASPTGVQELTSFGITPAQLYRALLTVGDMVQEVSEKYNNEAEIHLIVREDYSYAQKVLISGREKATMRSEHLNKYLVPEIGSFAEVDRGLAGKLLTWAIKAAKVAPFLFPGCKVIRSAENKVVVKATNEKRSVWS